MNNQIPLKTLLEALDKDYNTREEACKTLREAGDPVIQRLLAVLKGEKDDENIDLADAITGLGWLGDLRALEPLLTLIRNSDNILLGEKAAWALLSIRSQEAVQPLVRALNDENATVRAAAAWALAGIKSSESVEPLISALSDSDGKVRENAAFTLATIADPRTAPLLVALFEDETVSKNIKDSIHLGLAQMGKPALEPLVEALKSSDDSTRYHAATTLGMIASKEVVEAVIPLLNDPNEQVMIQAVWALGKIGDRRALAPLLSMFHRGLAKGRVIEALGGLKDDSVVELLEDALEDGLLDRSAARALAHIGTEKVIKPLIRAARVEDVRMLEAAKNGMRNVGELAIDPLIECLSDSDFQIREFALDLLGEMRSTKAVSRIMDVLAHDEDDLIRVDAAIALGEIGDARAKESLEKALNDPYKFVRESARDALEGLEGD
jgi:HEAT repeat protein